MNDIKLTRRQVQAYLSLVKASRGGSSIDIAEMLAREKGRPPTPDDHDTIVLATEFAVRSGLVSGHAALARGHVKVYVDLALTDKGEVRLNRLEHRLWWLSVTYEEIKDFLARVVGEYFKQ